MAKVKWGIISCAGIAKKAVVPAIIAAGNSDLHAIASRSLAKANDFAKEYSIPKSYGSYNDLLNDPDIDAVYLPLPNALHKEWTLKALQAGKHVLCEKPLATNEKDVLEMIKVAENYNKILMEAFMYRFHPLTKAVKKYVSQGSLGKIKRISASFSFNSSRPAGDIRFSKELGGGALNDIGCYAVNLSRYLAGAEPVAVYNSWQERSGTGVDNTGIGVLEFPDGLMANIFYSMGTYASRGVEVNGTKGQIIIPDFFSWQGEEDRSFYLVKEDASKEIKVAGAEQYQLQIEEFSKAVLNERMEAPLAVKDDALANRIVMDALAKSAETGKRVYISN